MSCYCDTEQPSFYVAEERKARKPHKCCECGHVIAPGETYEHVSGKWDGYIGCFHTCVKCADLRDAVAGFAGCFNHGGLADEYYEYLNVVLVGKDIEPMDVYSRVMDKHRQAGSA